jgi:hypothetical protein
MLIQANAERQKNLEGLDVLVEDQIVFQMRLVNIVENLENQVARLFQNADTKSVVMLENPEKSVVMLENPEKSVVMLESVDTKRIANPEKSVVMLENQEEKEVLLKIIQ